MKATCKSCFETVTKMSDKSLVILLVGASLVCSADIQMSEKHSPSGSPEPKQGRKRQRAEEEGSSSSGLGPQTPGSSGPEEKKKGAAGHAGNFERGGFFYKLEVENSKFSHAQPAVSCMPLSSCPNIAPHARTPLAGFENERDMLQRLKDEKDEPMRAFAPEFDGVEEIDGKRYLKMRTLFEGFDSATLCQMDIKMGVRCFAEKELQSKKPRADLYERLCKLDANEPTAEEHTEKAITKARWMTIRDALSSTTKLGFRVDAVVTPTSERKAFGDLWKVRSDAEVLDALRGFLPAECKGKERRALVEQLLARLEALETALRASSLFQECEVIGSSLLFAADATGKLGVWMLDFGLTGPCPAGALKHDTPWVEGNHEDGYLTGVANLRRLWRMSLEKL